MFRVFCLVTLLCGLSLPCLAEFRAQVDRTSLSMNETLTLTLSIDAQVGTQSLDFSVLQDDFEILGTSPASSVSIINGRQSAQTRWVVTLLPHSAGTLTIPAFNLNGETTNPISIEVSQASSQIGDSPISAQIELGHESIYVNQQLIITVSLISSPQVSALSGEQLQVENADISLLEQQSFNRVINGENWQVNQWKYAVFTQSPGQLSIPSQTFSGVVGAASRSPFSPLNNPGRRILARTEPLQVEVQPPPNDSGHWLPASDLSLEVVWSGNPNTLEVGEPMTRTIVTRATGQQAAALQPVSIPETGQFKIYADQPALDEQTTSAALIAERRDSAAIVPSQAGEITFPEVRLRWWNTRTQDWDEALLPAETISVAPASTPTTIPGESAGAPADSGDPEESETELQAPEITDESSPAQGTDWSWVSWILLAFILILGLDNWRLRRSPGPRAAKPSARRGEPSEWKALLKILKEGEPLQIRAALLVWADQEWPEDAPHNLHRLRERADTELEDHLREIEAACSSPRGEVVIKRAPLRRALENWHSRLRAEKQSASGALPRLYPG